MSEVENQSLYPKRKCSCGRSPTGYCVSLHSMTNEQYKIYLEQQQSALNEQAKPQFLVD